MTKFALIGAGRIGQVHAQHLSRHAEASIRYVVDVNQSAAQELAQRCGGVVSSVEQALADPDVGAVLIASSTNTHAQMIVAAARAGKAILCEKPLDLDVATAQNSLDEAERHGVPLAIGFNRRHDPTFSRLHAALKAGDVGRTEVVSITSRDPSAPPPEYVRQSGGLFRDMMIHDFDMGRWLLGEEPVQVFAQGSVLIDPGIGEAGDIDTAIAILTTASGKMCQITNSRRCSYGYDQRIEAFGSKGMLSAGNATATRLTSLDAQGQHAEPALPFFLERYADAYRLQLDSFVRLLAGEQAELPSGQDGLIALKTADAAQRSMETGVPVAL